MASRMHRVQCSVCCPDNLYVCWPTSGSPRLKRPLQPSRLLPLKIALPSESRKDGGCRTRMALAQPSPTISHSHLYRLYHHTVPEPILVEAPAIRTFGLGMVKRQPQILRLTTPKLCPKEQLRSLGTPERRLGPRSLGMTAQQGEGLCGNDRSSEMIDLGWGKATADAIRLASLGSSCSGRALRLTTPKLCPKEQLHSLGAPERRSGLRSLRMTAQRCEVAVRVAAKSRRDWSVLRAAPDSIA
jgi:hypothetical protein